MERARGVGVSAGLAPNATTGLPVVSERPATCTYITVRGRAAHNEMLNVPPRQARVRLERERQQAGRDRGGGRGATERAVRAARDVGRRQVLRSLPGSDREVTKHCQRRLSLFMIHYFPTQ